MEKNNTVKEHHNTFIESLKDRMVFEIQHEGNIISGQLLDSVSLYSYLLLRINTRGCQICIHNTLKLLEDVSEAYSEKIIIIGTFTTEAELEYYKRKISPKYKVIDIENQNFLNNQTDESLNLYFFTIDENNKIRNLFIPDKNFPFLTELYLKNILPCIN